jgi:hypothetical protein
MATLNVGTMASRLGGAVISTANSGAKPPAQTVALVREFARRTAQEHRENLQPAHSQLRLINSIARETLVTTREFSPTHTARARRN